MDIKREDVNEMKFEIMVEPDILCDSRHRIVKICINPQCRLALRCDQVNCKDCGVKIHQICSSIPLAAVTHILNERIGQCQGLIFKTAEIDNKLIQTIQTSNREFVSHHHRKHLPANILQIIDKIYKNRDSHKSVTGQEGKQLSQIVQEFNCSSPEIIARAFQEYRDAIAKIIKEVIDLKKTLFRQLIEPSKCTKSQIPIDSVILNGENQALRSQLRFMVEALDNPKAIQLLYRGSKESFKAETFHQKCGDVENTLTLVRTEFGRVLAGFTPYKWHSVPHKSWVKNPEGGTFLLSLDNLEKMYPIDTNCLIQNYSSYGPTFGGGNDLYISDLCNNNNNSYANFPTSYNTKDLQYKNSQNSYRSFSGATYGCNFRVIEYEVFRVVR